MLFKFQGSFEYGSSGCVSKLGIPLPTTVREHPRTNWRLIPTYLPCVVECTSAPYSTSTVSVGVCTSRQNSSSTSSSVTTMFPKRLA